MEALRSFTKWISKHRFFSITCFIVIFILIVSLKNIISRSQGTLSEPLRKGLIVDSIYGIGTVTAARSYSIRPGVIATITDLYVKEGDHVQKGSKLANIDNIVYRAPFDGVVNYLPFKVGENIFTQIPMLAVTDLSNRYLLVSLEQQGALRVRVGQKARLSFDSLRGQVFEGKVESVYSYNGNFLARIGVASLPPELLPDMTADVAIVVREKADVLLVPTAALENDTVWLKKAHRIPVQIHIKLGIVDAAMAEIISGDLKEGDQVLIRRKLGT